MKKTIIVFGSSTGTCEGLADNIAKALGIDAADVINAADITSEQLAAADNIILGTSTWGAGDLQDDWYTGIEVIKSTDLTGKTVAIFGCGDSAGFSTTFCGAMAELYNAAKDAGATLVGEVSTDGYTFDDSAAVIDGKFCGLALDELNESDLTDERIAAWLTQLQL